MAEDKMKDENVMDEEDLTVEDIAFMANDKIDALIEILDKKGIVKEDEVMKKIEELYKEEEEE